MNEIVMSYQPSLGQP